MNMSVEMKKISPICFAVIQQVLKEAKHEVIIILLIKVLNCCVFMYTHISFFILPLSV